MSSICCIVRHMYTLPVKLLTKWAVWYNFLWCHFKMQHMRDGALWIFIAAVFLSSECVFFKSNSLMPGVRYAAAYKMFKLNFKCSLDDTIFVRSWINALFYKSCTVLVIGVLVGFPKVEGHTWFSYEIPHDAGEWN